MKVNPTAALLAVIIVPVLLIVSVMFYVSMRPVAADVAGDRLRVDGGLYHEDVPLATIENVSLVDALPPIRYRSNGFAFGRTLRGQFHLRDFGSGRTPRHRMRRGGTSVSFQSAAFKPTRTASMARSSGLGSKAVRHGAKNSSRDRLHRINPAGVWVFSGSR